MLRHPDFLYAFDVRGLYFHANLITEISTKVKSKKLPGNYSRQSCVFYSAIHRVLDCIFCIISSLPEDVLITIAESVEIVD